MQRCAPQTTSNVSASGEGPGVSLHVTQDTSDPGGWTLELFAQFPGNRRSLMATILLAPANVRLPDRVLFVGGAPGAVGWSAIVKPPAPGILGATAPPLLVGLVASPDLVTNLAVST